MKTFLLATAACASLAIHAPAARADRVIPPAITDAVIREAEILKPRFEAAQTSCPALISVATDFEGSKPVRDFLLADNDPGFTEPLPSVHVIVGGDYRNGMQGKKSFFNWSICKGDPAAAKLALTAQEYAAYTRWSTQKSKEALTIQHTAPAAKPSLDENGLPYYDVDRSCHRYDAPSYHTGFNWCRNKEQEAYNTLKWMWPQLRSWKDTCVAMNAGQQFYQTLEQCASQAYATQIENDRMSSSQPFRR
jgi:hypothetical protein